MAVEGNQGFMAPTAKLLSSPLSILFSMSSSSPYSAPPTL
jgi:hypothetical protein